MSVAECMTAVDADELGWWQAYDRYEPIGREAEVLAIGFAIMVNLQLAKAGVKGSRYETADFMPQGTIRPDAGKDDAAAVEGKMQAEVRRRG